MQITAIDSSSQNFKALKGITVTGGFKKEPALAKEVLESINSNKTIQDFCDRWNTNILLTSTNESFGKTVARVKIFYNDIVEKNGIKKIFSKFIESCREEKSVECDGWGISLRESVDELKKGINDYGTIDGQINYVNKVADEKSAKKAKKIQDRLDRKLERQKSEASKTAAKNELNDYINKMTKK